MFGVVIFGGMMTSRSRQPPPASPKSERYVLHNYSNSSFRIWAEVSRFVGRWGLLLDARQGDY